jgi:uncharacterized membrane protein
MGKLMFRVARTEDTGALARSVKGRRGGLYGGVGILGTAVAVGAMAAMPSNVGNWIRVFLYWDIQALIYLLVTWAVFLWSSTDNEVRDLALRDDRHRRWGLFVMMSMGSLFALAAAVFVLPQIAELERAAPRLLFILAVVAVVEAWLVAHTAFAAHYTYLYYRKGTHQGFGFPGNESPSYIDFVYFACSVGTTFGTTDVEVKTTELRSVVMRHGLLSFVFNTAILALTISFLANTLD